jgi:hypothetical protein
VYIRSEVSRETDKIPAPPPQAFTLPQSIVSKQQSISWSCYFRGTGSPLGRGVHAMTRLMKRKFRWGANCYFPVTTRSLDAASYSTVIVEAASGRPICRVPGQPYGASRHDAMRAKRTRPFLASFAAWREYWVGA